MKIFISWSGKQSNTIANALREWILNFFGPKYIKVWMSDKDIGPGVSWIIEMKKALKGAEMAILCITSENISAPWVIYEAGAISNSFTHSLIIPYLIDVGHPELPPPLRQFQSAMADKKGTYGIVKTINNIMGDNALDNKALENRFKDLWPSLNIEIKKSNCDFIHSEDVYDIWRVARDMVKNVPKDGNVYDTTSVNNTPEYEEQIEEALLRGVKVTRIVATDNCSHSLKMYIKPPSFYREKTKQIVYNNLSVFHFPFPNPIDILITIYGEQKESILGFKSSLSLDHHPPYNSALYISSKKMTEKLFELYEKVLESKSHNYHKDDAPIKDCKICREILSELKKD